MAVAGKLDAVRQPILHVRDERACIPAVTSANEPRDDELGVGARSSTSPVAMPIISWAGSRGRLWSLEDGADTNNLPLFGQAKAFQNVL